MIAHDYMARLTCSRRRFLKRLAGASLPLSLGWNLPAEAKSALQRVRFGLCADPHKDIMHDADARLRTFIDKATENRVDFILQLGDFCTPKEQNRGFLKIWESFSGPRYHTLGNHEIDGGFAWEQVLAFWKMDRRYYSFDQGGWHFLVLDGNEKKPAPRAPGYPRYIGAEQLNWLAEDLRKTTAPTLVFSHQSLEDPGGVENSEEVRRVLEKANARAKWRQVGACLSGHHHIDYQTEINGIAYVQVNSMSYAWLGEKFAHVRYGPEIDRAFPNIKYTAPYRDPLFAMVTLTPEGGFEMEGTRSEFVGPSPWDVGVEEQKGTTRDKDRLVPRISDRKLALAVS